MKKSIEEKLKSYPNVRNMLEGLPEDIRYIFMPVTTEDLQELELNILAFKKRTTERERVIMLQKMMGYNLRPNMTLHEMNVIVKINGKKKDQLFRRYMDKKNDEEDHPNSFE